VKSLEAEEVSYTGLMERSRSSG